MFAIKSSSLAAAIFLASSFSATADTLTAPMSASAQVPSSCLVTSTTGMSFGVYNAVLTNNAKDASSSVSVRCTANAQGVRMSFDQGANPAPGSTCAAPSRRMKSANGDYLSYNLYADVNRTVVRGCQFVENDHAFNSSAFTNSDTIVSVLQYGRIPAAQDSRATTYADTVGVTITF